MKNLVFGLIATVLFAFTTNAQNLLNEETIGRAHNQQLDVYYENISNLLKKNKESKIKQSDFYKLYDEQIFSLLGNENKELTLSAISGFKTELNNALEESINNKINQIKDTKNISNDLKTFLLNLINDYDNVEDNKVSEFYDLKKDEANKLFKEKELEIALLSINVGKSSFEYWDNNIEKWNTLIKETGSTTILSKGTVGKADLVGAIAGGIWGAWGGTAFLPGVGTVTGAVAVGFTSAFYMSLVAAVKTLVDLF